MPRRRPPPPTVGNLLHALAWSTGVRKSITLTAGAIAAVAGAITAANSAWPIIDPAIPALHYWVNSQIAPILMVQNTQANAIDRYLLYQQMEALDKAKADSAAATSPIVKERIKDLESQIQDTEARVRAHHSK